MGEVELDPAIFDLEPSMSLIHEAMIAQRANARQSLAHTKTRGDVRGGGKKPWKQKGTGRARHGSTRSPIWVGGGVAHGPRNDQNFSVKINRKARRKALCMVLSDRVKEAHLIALDSLTVPNGKTASLAKSLGKLPSAGKKTLLVVENTNVGARRAARNLPKVTTIAPGSLNVGDLLSHAYIVVDQTDLSTVSKTYAR